VREGGDHWHTGPGRRWWTCSTRWRGRTGANYFDFGNVCWGREGEPAQSHARNVQSFAQSGY
jgi:hypothetical protein